MPVGGIPIREGVWTLTGERRYRTTWRGKIVLQVEETERTGVAAYGQFHWSGHNVRWRDATIMDLQSAINTKPTGVLVCDGPVRFEPIGDRVA